jgi:hypothetical protein
MADTLLPDDSQTLQRLDSVACIFEWTHTMSTQDRKRFFGALAECGDAVQQVVFSLLGVIKNPNTSSLASARVNDAFVVLGMLLKTRSQVEHISVASSPNLRRTHSWVTMFSKTMPTDGSLRLPASSALIPLPVQPETFTPRTVT